PNTFFIQDSDQRPDYQDYTGIVDPKYEGYDQAECLSENGDHLFSLRSRYDIPVEAPHARRVKREAELCHFPQQSGDESADESTLPRRMRLRDEVEQLKEHRR